MKRRTGRGRRSLREGWRLTLRRRRRRMRSTWMNMIIIQMNMNIMRRMRSSKYENFHTKVKLEKINQSIIPLRNESFYVFNIVLFFNGTEVLIFLTPISS